jgi:putative FmdB family regulatory protein
MPVYDYLCQLCGPFTEMRPMAEADAAQSCPGCARAAPRALLTAPYLATMAADRRLAFATNERSAAAPKVMAAGKHGSGCGCCSGKSMRYKKKGGAVTTRGGAKGFPSRRPWMISH